VQLSLSDNEFEPTVLEIEDTVPEVVFGMIIGDRLRQLRDAKRLSQGDIEKRTGLFRCYISRVERK
jgi:hypothetical protein